LKEQKFEPDTYVINQGDYGNYFYIVLEGKLIAEKRDLDDPNSVPSKVYDYDEGSYFGELALLHDCKRQASVKTLTKTTLACIEREAFMRLLGSLEDILKRNEERYKVIQQEITA
jgi:cAMP-dependent protein kinase regulator